MVKVVKTELVLEPFNMFEIDFIKNTVCHAMQKQLLCYCITGNVGLKRFLKAMECQKIDNSYWRVWGQKLQLMLKCYDMRNA